ncbi:uncharacterized protein TNCV_2297261 [Trichonephila clavipes]|nr:uncharacterized protein TNCV_2297261 [Trichonephila clavipes]
MEVTTVWKVLRKRLELRPYRLQLLQALKSTDYSLRTKFTNDMLIHANENVMDYVVLRDKSTFHFSGHVNTDNVRSCSLENPHEVLELQRDLPKVNVFCAISRLKANGPFIFGEPTATGSVYLYSLQLWLFPQLEEREPDNFIWQQDGAPPRWHLSVRDWLNINGRN